MLDAGQETRRWTPGCQTLDKILTRTLDAGRRIKRYALAAEDQVQRTLAVQRILDTAEDSAEDAGSDRRRWTLHKTLYRTSYAGQDAGLYTRRRTLDAAEDAGSCRRRCISHWTLESTLDIWAQAQVNIRYNIAQDAGQNVRQYAGAR